MSTRSIWLAAFLIPLPVTAGGAELEGTPWYDADGRLVLVEGPAAEPAPRRFIPEWRLREIERARRMHATRSRWSDDSWVGGWYGWSGRRVWRGHGCHVARPSAVFHRGGFRTHGYLRPGGACRGGGLHVIIRR